MGLFKKIAKGVGRFAKKVAKKAVKPALSLAATVVGGPAAGALVNKAVGLLGEKKTTEMAEKVVSDGVVKADKVEKTLSLAGLATPQNVQTVVGALKSAASGMTNKSIGVSGFTGGVTTSGSSNPSLSISFKDRLVGWWNSLKNWVIEHKTLVMIVGGIVASFCVYYFGFGKKKKWRV